MLASLVQTPAAFFSALCALASAGADKKGLPRRWRSGFGKIHGFMGCGAPAESGEALYPSSEVFLKGLEYPGTYFRAELIKQEGEKAGIQITPKRDFLEVDKVLDSGAVARWNEANVPRALRQGDRLIAVNGVRGNGTRMKSELATAANVSIHVFRLGAEDLEAISTRKAEERVKKLVREPGPPGLGQGIPEPPGSKIAVLHSGNIDRFIEMQPVSLVMFYASWCGHCKHLAPEFTRAADLVAEMGLSKSVRLAKFDDGDAANRNYKAGSAEKFNFSSYPSFAYISDGESVGFYGADGAQEIAAQVRARVEGLDIEVEVQEVIFNLRPMLYRPDVDSEKVLDLEPETFDDLVMKDTPENNRVWIIEFYSDKCPFCKSLKPEYVKASESIKTHLGDRVKFGAVNSRAFHLLAQRMGVTSYPWIIAVYAGQKLEDMAGLGGAQSVIDWTNKHFKASWREDPKWSEKAIEWPKLEGDKEEEALLDNSTGSWRELLGRRTWFFLHTLAAKYPEEPTLADQAAVRHLVAALGQHYPCPVCRIHLRQKLLDPKLGPVPTGMRQDLTQWFCKLHNMVNTDLNKTRMKCNAFELDLKYLKSCGECSAKGPDAPEKGSTVSWDFFDYLQNSEKVEVSKEKEERASEL